LTHKAEKLGYHPDVILAGRRINDGMGEYLANQIVKDMIANNQAVKGAKIGVLGITFKEDCPDIRNSKVIDVIRGLQSWGLEVIVHDPHAESAETEHEYGISLSNLDSLSGLDAVVTCVAHKEYREMSAANYKQMLSQQGGVFDVKCIMDRKAFADEGVRLWRL
jgi:UDP-N-acetyl-D-galactosamine dehydrogenase